MFTAREHRPLTRVCGWIIELRLWLECSVNGRSHIRCCAARCCAARCVIATIKIHRAAISQCACERPFGITVRGLGSRCRGANVLRLIVYGVLLMLCAETSSLISLILLLSSFVDACSLLYLSRYIRRWSRNNNPLLHGAKPLDCMVLAVEYCRFFFSCNATVTLLGGITCTECKDAACCYRCSVVCLSVCVSVGLNREPYRNG